MAGCCGEDFGDSVEVDRSDLVLVIARADAFTEWDDATWKARNRLVRAMGLEDEDDA